MNQIRPMRISVLLTLLLSASFTMGRGAPVTPQVAKDFKNFIVQGERPEIASCMAASLTLFKKNKSFKNFSWLEANSENAIMREKEVDGYLVRTIQMNARTILNDQAFFDSWTDVLIQCEQKDQAEPLVKVTILKSN